jgi:transcriptional regulator with XRE-family HTH domain
MAPDRHINKWEALRFERGLTQREVAEGSGISLSTLIRVEKGTQRPGAGVVKAAADYFGVQVTDLMAPDEKAAA